MDLQCSLIQGSVDITDILQKYDSVLKQRSYYHLGYPYNLDYDYTILQSLVNYSINNLGDPFIESNYGVHSRPFEIAILDWFAELWEIPTNTYWGYVTSCGTEGNLYGVWLGREHVTKNNSSKPLLIASEETHYSAWKAARMFQLDVKMIPTNTMGEINIEKFTTTIVDAKIANQPLVIIGNVGTTIKGAFDDIQGMVKCLKQAGYTTTDFYIHLDGALSGTILPFLKGDSLAKSALSFRNDEIGSISASGHKFIGSPIPCGILITRKTYLDNLSVDISYIASKDSTILGSRNGHAPLYLWYSIAKKGKHGLLLEITECLENAKYLFDCLNEKKIPNLLMNNNSSTVVFQKPSNQAFIYKWQLACHNDLCHVVVMPNITKTKIDEFLHDLLVNGY
jgi:histidine decarboxylase